jgi:hypothetical protein
VTTPARRPVRTLGAILAATALALGGVLVAPLSAQAATLTVTSSADSGAGSLRDVIAASNPGDTIVFDPSVTSIALQTGIDIDWGVTIDGGSSVTITRANTNNFSQFYFSPEQPDQDITFANITIMGITDSYGAAIGASYGDNNNQPNDVTLSNVIIRDETNVYGAALNIFQGLGDVLVEDSLIENNTLDFVVPQVGGAFNFESVHGDIAITNTVFRGNVNGNGDGGAIAIPYLDTPDSLIITGTTFDSNEASGDGGAIFIGQSDGTVLIDSSTFTGNVVGDESAGVSLAIPDISGGAVTILNSTFDEQVTGSPVLWFSNDGGDFRLSYSTVVGDFPLYFVNAFGGQTVLSSILNGLGNPAISVETPDDPVVVSYSILSSGPTGFIADNGGTQFSVADPKLGPLQDNGGPTLTRLPLAGSPAIDKGAPGGTPPEFDQRGAGFPRVIGGRVDIGAVETSYPLAATGQTLNLWIPIIGGVLLLGGATAIFINVLRRRRLG